MGLLSGFSQIAKIIDMGGSVSIKQTKSSNWQPAKIDMYLDKDAELKTAKGAFCTLSFDERLENILTIQENSHIRIESLSPGEIFLPKGRVFSLIEDLARLQQFSVRTPVAVAGVRGTGDSVEHGKLGTVIKCFEGEIQTLRLNTSGKIIAQEILSEGRGVDVDRRGAVRKMFELSDFERHEWNRFRTAVDQRRQDYGSQGASSPRPSLDAYQSQPKHIIDERFLLDADEPAWQPDRYQQYPKGSVDKQYPHEEQKQSQPASQETAPESEPEAQPASTIYNGTKTGSSDTYNANSATSQPAAPGDNTVTYKNLKRTGSNLKQEQMDSFRDNILLDKRSDQNSSGGYQGYP